MPERLLPYKIPKSYVKWRDSHTTRYLYKDFCLSRWHRVRCWKSQAMLCWVGLFKSMSSKSIAESWSLSYGLQVDAQALEQQVFEKKGRESAEALRDRLVNTHQSLSSSNIPQLCTVCHVHVARLEVGLAEISRQELACAQLKPLSNVAPKFWSPPPPPPPTLPQVSTQGVGSCSLTVSNLL